MLRRFTAVLAFLTAACAGHTLPPVTPRTFLATGPATLNVSAAKTWQATVDVVADRSAATRTLSRESGFIESGNLDLTGWSLDERYRVADCGGHTAPEYVRLTFTVRGDSAQSTVEVRTAYVGVNDGGAFACRTTGQLEHDLVREIRAKAEAR